MHRLARRSLLAVPLLALPGVARAGGRAVPPFPDWIGRTALLRGDGGAARLLLAPDGTGLMAVRLFLFCRTLAIRSWEGGADGASLRYSRVSALDSSRLIQGEARILPDTDEVLWIEATIHRAAFEGFAAADAAGRCG
jgi:hypothetical protein